MRPTYLLDFDFGAGFFKLLLDSRRFVLVNALFDGLGRAVDQVLGFFQAQAGHFANRLDAVTLFAAHLGEYDVKSLFLSRRARPSRPPAPSRYHSGRSCGNAEG